MITNKARNRQGLAKLTPAELANIKTFAEAALQAPTPQERDEARARVLGYAVITGVDAPALMEACGIDMENDRALREADKDETLRPLIEEVLRKRAMEADEKPRMRVPAGTSRGPSEV